MTITPTPTTAQDVPVDLQVSISDSPDPVAVGQELTYEITILNRGTSQATGISLNDALPDSAMFVNASLAGEAPVQALSSSSVLLQNACEYKARDHSVSCALGSLGSQQQVEVEIVVLPTAEGLLINWASVSSSAGGSDPATNNVESEQSAVIPAPAIFASKTDRHLIDADNDGVPSPGDVIEYVVQIVNSGSTPATQVVFTDTPDSRLTIMANTLSTSQGHVIEGNQPGDTSINIEVGFVPGNGGDVEIRYQVTVADSIALPVARLTNQGEVSGNNFQMIWTDDPNTAEIGDPTHILVYSQRQAEPATVPTATIFGLFSLIASLGLVLLFATKRIPI